MVPCNARNATSPASRATSAIPTTSVGRHVTSRVSAISSEVHPSPTGCGVMSTGPVAKMPAGSGWPPVTRPDTGRSPSTAGDPDGRRSQLIELPGKSPTARYPVGRSSAIRAITHRAATRITCSWVRQPTTCTIATRRDVELRRDHRCGLVRLTSTRGSLTPPFAPSDGSTLTVRPKRRSQRNTALLRAQSVWSSLVERGGTSSPSAIPV